MIWFGVVCDRDFGFPAKQRKDKQIKARGKEGDRSWNLVEWEMKECQILKLVPHNARSVNEQKPNNTDTDNTAKMTNSRRERRKCYFIKGEKFPFVNWLHFNYTLAPCWDRSNGNPSIPFARPICLMWLSVWPWAYTQNIYGGWLVSPESCRHSRRY